VVAVAQANERQLFYAFLFRRLRSEIAIASQQPHVVFALEPRRALFREPSNELARADFSDARLLRNIEASLAGLRVTDVGVQPTRVLSLCQFGKVFGREQSA
jgi:hypothetical protein